MAAVKDHASVAQPFSNALELMRFTYDFAKDGGATGALDLATAAGNLLIHSAWLTVKTTCTSGGSATVKWGKTGNDDIFANIVQGAVASLVAGASIVPPVVATSTAAVTGAEGDPTDVTTVVESALPVPWASGDKLLMTIGTATLLTGKIEFCVVVSKA